MLAFRSSQCDPPWGAEVQHQMRPMPKVFTSRRSPKALWPYRGGRPRHVERPLHIGRSSAVQPKISAASAWLSSLPSQRFKIRTNFISRTPCNTAVRFILAPLPGAIPKPDRSCVTRTGHIVCYRHRHTRPLTLRIQCSCIVLTTTVEHRGAGIRQLRSDEGVMALVTDLDILRTAKSVLDYCGRDALTHAAQHADELLERGDTCGDTRSGLPSRAPGLGQGPPHGHQLTCSKSPSGWIGSSGRSWSRRSPLSPVSLGERSLPMRSIGDATERGRLRLLHRWPSPFTRRSAPSARRRVSCSA